ncbi:MAG: hypothetical protein F7C36_04140 [Desulfurococcales archaeon]|nr:hypothetical protein [Desulfurococcales archaeon]
MPAGKIVVVGDKLNLPLFRSAGMSVVEADNTSEVLRVLRSVKDEASLVVVLKHVVDDQERVIKAAEELNIPILILPTVWSPAEKINVEKLLARALGLG